MNINSSLFCVIISLMLGSLKAQDARPVDTEVQKSFAIKIGVTKPVKELVSRTYNGADKKRYYKSRTIPPRNFVGRIDSRVIQQRDHNTGPDKIRQTDINKRRSIPVEPLFNVEGLNSGGSPHDPTGDVGRDYYVQAVNSTNIGIYDKTSGVKLMEFSANTLWTTLGFNSGGDPIVLYDQELDRWLITEFPSGFGANFNQLLVAVSESSDPMGSYSVYNFNTPNFPDYPKYAIWSNAIAVTTNEQGGGVLHSYFINREELMAGEDIVTVQRVSHPGTNNTEAGFFVATPVDWTGKQAPPSDRGPIILALNDASWNTDQEEDRIEIFSLNIDWNNESNTTWNRLSLDVSPYDSYPCADAGFWFSCIPQLDGVGLDGIPETIMNQTHYRNFGTHESMVLNFITDVTDGQDLSGIRWMELRRTAEEDWRVYQEGTYSPDDGLHRFMGGIAMDGAGNIALAYNVSSDSTYAGIRYTGRRAGDPLGEMTVDEYIVVEGEGSINDGSRFGDYAHMVVDPFNDKTFYYTSEYGGLTGSRTRIIAYELNRDSFDLAPVNLKNPVSGSMLTDSELVEVSVRNFGINTIDSFDLSYQLDGAAIQTETIVFSLEQDSIYEHVFGMPADLSAYGEHQLKVFSSSSLDKAVFNDTLNITINHIPDIDMALDRVEMDSEVICGTATTFGLVLENVGFDTIETALIRLSVNGVETGHFNYSGELLAGTADVLEIPVDALVDGENLIEFYIEMVNGEDELFISNNDLTHYVQVISNGYTGTLRIQFDDYPEETSWKLEDENGVLIAEGGPYLSDQAQEILETEICLDPELCYLFTILDSYGDGISFGGVEGNYEIYDESGQVLASLIDPAFGDEEVNEFCAVFECMVEIEAYSSPSTGPGVNDGIIMVEVLGGLGPFNYSIDGGVTVQSSNVFSDLEPGRYVVLVSGANACTDEFEIEVLECGISAIFELTHESDSLTMDGGIEILVSGGFDPVSYSIDGGLNFSSDNLFSNLALGEYSVVVEDSLGCRFTEVVRIGNITSTDDEQFGSLVKLYPNPTDGVFRIEVEGLQSSVHQIPMYLYDINGKLIQRALLSKYDSKHIGIMSLYHYPAGSYFIKIESERLDELYRIVKN